MPSFILQGLAVIVLVKREKDVKRTKVAKDMKSVAIKDAEESGKKLLQFVTLSKNSSNSFSFLMKLISINR